MRLLGGGNIALLGVDGDLVASSVVDDKFRVRRLFDERFRLDSDVSDVTAVTFDL